MLSITTIVILMLLLMGIIVGSKNGFFKQVVLFVGTLLVFFLAYILKNPLVSLFYNYLPFIDFHDGTQVLNILFYECLAFFIVAIVLFGILNILVKFTDIFEKILNATIILGIPSKILGAVVGFLQYYVIVFVGLYFLCMPMFNLDFISNNSLSNNIVKNTPILSNVLGKELSTVEEIINLNNKYKNKNNEYNLKVLDIMLKNRVITVESADVLIKKDKLDINGAQGIINRYRGVK